MKKTVIPAVVLLGIILVPVCGSAKNTDEPDLGYGVQDVQSVNARALKPNNEFGKTPLYFIANNGQVDKEAVFYAKASGYSLWLTKAGVVFDASIPIEDETLSDGQPESSAEIGRRMRRSVSELVFVGANTNPEIVALDATEHKVNYFKGGKANWRTGIPTFRAVLYKNIYSNIDLKVYGMEKRVEYDWIVHPGGNPDQIKIEYRNVRATAIDSNGDIAVETGIGELVHRHPVSYQVASSAGARDPETEAVHVAFCRVSENIYGLDVGEYDTTRKLIIDPVIDVEYSTYLGGGDYDIAYEVQVDGNRCAYITGITESDDFPTTSGSYDETRNGNYDFFVAKFSPSGDALVYSTYIGGSSIDYALDLVVDATGAVYVTGYSYSDDFPTVNPFQSTNRGSPDIVVLKLNPAGDTLEYSTYIGGSDIEYAKGIAIDDTGSAYVFGETFSTNYPTQNPYMGEHPNPGDPNSGRALCVTKFSPSGSNLIYSTYFGGSEEDDGGDIAVDEDGVAYICGETFSDDFPVYQPYQSTQMNTRCAFLTKFAPSGESLLYSTFFAGSYTFFRNIAVDEEGYMYLVGDVSDQDMPTTNAYQNARAGYLDVCLVKFTPSGDALVYSTYFGGSQNDYGYRIAVDRYGYAYITGYTFSGDFPLANPYQNTLKGDRDAFVAIFSPEGNTLESSTYYGGSYRDYGYGIALDASRNIYLAGQTRSDNFLTTNAYQDAYAGTSDAFLAKFTFFPEGEIYQVVPASGSWTGGYQVVISGTNLGNGSDIADVLICGASAASIDSQSATQVVVTAGVAASAGTGDVVVYSPSYGHTTKSNAFTCLREEQAALVFSPDSPQPYKSTNALSTTGGSGTGVVSYAVLSGPGLIVGDTNLAVTSYVGTIEIRATKAQDGRYFASSVTGTVKATKANQEINNFLPPDETGFAVTDTVYVSATGGESGNPVVFASLPDSPVVWVNATTMQFNATGDVYITADQAGNEYYFAAPTITNHYTIAPAVGTFYVDASQSDDSGLGTSWSEAKKTIQAAVDIAAAGSTVLVTNGMYSTGGAVTPGMALSNRVVISKAITVESVNGPDATFIVGNGPSDPVRCAYLTNSAALYGFTLTNGHTVTVGDYYDKTAAGVFFDHGGTVSNCVIRNCTSKGSGGGAFMSHGGAVIGCRVIGNESTDGDGGGACLTYGGSAERCVFMRNDGYMGGGINIYDGGTLDNCLVASNTATYGGGVYSYKGEVDNCTICDNTADSRSGGLDDSSGGPYYNNIIYHNSSPTNANVTVGGGTFDHTCTIPGVGSNCITNAPAFVDRAADNYRVYQNSLTVDAGTDTHASTPADLDGNDRIQGSAVDLGAYEYRADVDPDSSPVHYVWINSPAPLWPYTDWDSASHTIQAAVDAASDGDTVLVTNGVYDAGGAVQSGYSLTNRVMVERAVSVQSVNGRDSTFIVGAADPATTNGPAAVRCVYMVTNASLTGFTLQDGHTLAAGSTTLERSGGGALLDHGGIISNCVFSGNGADVDGGGAVFEYGGNILDCEIAGNHADDDAGGLYFHRGGYAAYCTISSNLSDDGGAGSYMYNGGEMNDCTIEHNISGGGGGGVILRGDALLRNSVVRSNHAGDGTTEDGGGVFLFGGTVRSCLIIENTATNAGGGLFFDSGASNAVVECCTIVSNSAEYGGGVRTWGGIVRNCVVYENTASVSGPNWSWGGNSPAIEYSCITPTNGIPGGEGCITNSPLFADEEYRLGAASPCIDAGTNRAWMTGARDLDGKTRIMSYIVDMGCYERVTEDTDSSPIHYVSLSGGDEWPYTNWTQAAHILQDAVDTATAGDTVLVTNGTYDTGGALTPGYALTNRVVIDKAVAVVSVNGPGHTFIAGAGPRGPSAIRCVYLTNGAALAGMTLTNGHTFSTGAEDFEQGGGGAFLDHGGTVSNCVVTGCEAQRYGGGVYVYRGGEIFESEIKNNAVSSDGGGIYINREGLARNLLIHHNTGFSGGGVYLNDNSGDDPRLNNCTVVDNTADFDGGGVRCINGGACSQLCGLLQHGQCASRIQ